MMAGAQLDCRVALNAWAGPSLTLIRKPLGYPSTFSLCACSRLCQVRPQSLEFCCVVILPSTIALQVSSNTFSCTSFLLVFACCVFPFFLCGSSVGVGWGAMSSEVFCVCVECLLPCPDECMWR